MKHELLEDTLEVDPGNETYASIFPATTLSRSIDLYTCKLICTNNYSLSFLQKCPKLYQHSTASNSVNAQQQVSSHRTLIILLRH